MIGLQTFLVLLNDPCLSTNPGHDVFRHFETCLRHTAAVMQCRRDALVSPAGQKFGVAKDIDPRTD